MKNMKKNVLLVSFIAVLALMTVGFASANLASGISTEFNGVELAPVSTMTMAGAVGDVVPVKDTFN
ncbi:MAG: hypothetical protein OEL89_01730, partial [Candidatus Peregrinibacteria bacterium]|nr:hypothetical protein [Candidatus Peregrinibacteria bacterium]